MNKKLKPVVLTEELIKRVSEKLSLKINDLERLNLLLSEQFELLDHKNEVLDNNIKELLRKIYNKTQN